MFSPTTGILFLAIYASIVILIALWVEWMAAKGRNIGNNPVIYTLSFAVWFTAWSFYGQVGRAATSGMLYLTSHLGATLSIILWWIVLRKMVRIRHTYRITSIADLISLRYDKSPSIAALATLIAIVGIVPYLALQLKAVISTFTTIVQTPGSAESSWATDNVGLVIVVFMILFTIMFGTRRIVPTERHQGMVVAMAVESCVKLIAFLTVGIFVTYFLYNGFGDIFRQFAGSPVSASLVASGTGEAIFPWVANLLMAMSAVIFVPALFHIMVVENFQESHIRTSMWLFPLFMFVINLFVLPIAMAGLLMGFPLQQADSYVLSLPYYSGQSWLTLFAFIGGFSSAMGMLVVNAMTLSTMFTNHILLPVIEKIPNLDFLKRYLLQCRWFAVTTFILASYAFERLIVQNAMLAEIGVYAFAAVLQFAPTIIGGLFWKRGNKVGAFLGMSSGLLVWLYTLILPAFVKGGLVGTAIMQSGPFGISWLQPGHLFGVQGLSAGSHAVFWTMFFNCGLYVLGSLFWEQTQDERNIAEKFVTALDEDAATVRAVAGQAVVSIKEKKDEIIALFSQYYPQSFAEEITGRCLADLNLQHNQKISIVELAELINEVEKRLASSIGAAAAHYAIMKTNIYSQGEMDELKRVYAEIMTELKLPPSELVTRIDYYREKERLLTDQAKALEATICERDKEIVDRRLAEEELAQEKERLAVTLRSIGDGVITTDINGMVLLINSVAEKLTGWNQEAAFGKPLLDVFPLKNEKTGELCENPLDMVARTGTIGGLDNYSILPSQDGTEQLIATSGAPIRDSESRIIGAVLVFRDVTEKVRMESELLKAQKLDSVGILAGGIAHDFNNILTAILGSISLARLYADPNEKLSSKLDEAEKASMRARDLTQQLLTFSRGGAPVKRNTLLNEVIKESAGFAISGSAVICNFNLADDLWAAEVDEGQISQVIHNMVINANQAMPQGGVINISAENVTISPELNLPLRPGRFIRISIEDTGVGMPKEYLDKIFDPYFTTKQTGSGLGLTSSYSIAKKHDGYITVESEVGAGTIFRIYLPASVASLTMTDRSGNQLHCGKGKVLVMDDDDAVRDAAGEMLAYLGYEADFARDGQEAIKLYCESMETNNKFAAVIMDLTIPGGMGGKEAIRQLLQIDPDVCGIVSSGYSTDTVMAEYREHGFCGVVTKPYKIDALSRVMQESLK